MPVNGFIHRVTVTLISSYQLFSAISWGKLSETFVVLTPVDIILSIR